ncbi:MAG: hypothetical protein EOP01_00545 [Propionibacteriaceae bacterium]|nr:MAG: hypothetical protein EOP01_00545 [Propionibacteriaceae bacterium]
MSDDGRSVGSDDAGDGYVVGEVGPELVKGEHPASPLAGLRAKREAAIAELFIDLAVPEYLDRLGVDLYVRYRPIPLSTAVKLREQMGRTKAPERHANANAAALATACEGIYYLVDGEERAFREDGDSTWPAFEPVVADTLGVSWINPTRLVRDLYFTDDHVAAAVQRIDSWATGEVRERQQDDSGN